MDIKEQITEAMKSLESVPALERLAMLRELKQLLADLESAVKEAQTE